MILMASRIVGMVRLSAERLPLQVPCGKGRMGTWSDQERVTRVLDERKKSSGG